MKLTRIDTIVLEMESKDFDSLMFFLKHAGDQTTLEDIDAKKAKDMYYSLHGMNK